jgi:glycerol-3-phosphate O-acyltransferase
LRDYLESYLLAALTLQDVATEGAMDRKSFVRAALDTGRAAFLSGRIGAAEALSRTTLENAVEFLLDQKILVEQEKKLRLGPGYTEAGPREKLAAEIRGYLERLPG